MIDTEQKKRNETLDLLWRNLTIFFLKKYSKSFGDLPNIVG